MARQIGANTFAGTLEVLAGGPLDARMTVPTKGDLVLDGNFPYPYVGMPVTVQSEGKLYILMDEDYTVLSNWKECSGGSGSDNIVEGYFNPDDSLFYEEATYETPIPGETKVVYISVDTENTYRYDGTNFVKLDPGSGGGVTENKITTTVDVGGIAEGIIYPAGTSLEQILTDLISPLKIPTLVNPSAILTPSGDVLLESGSTYEQTITCVFSRGSITPAYGTDGYRSGEAQTYSLNGGTAQAENTFDETISELNNTFVVNVTYLGGEQPKDSKDNDYDEPLPAGNINSEELVYEFVDAWWGNGEDPDDIEKMDLISKKPGEIKITFGPVEDGQAETFDVPASWTNVKIAVENSFTKKWDDCTSQFTVTNVTHENSAGQTVNYKRYTCNLGYAMGARELKITWSTT